MGFSLPKHRQYYGEYLRKLIELMHNKQIKVVLDSGENTSEGPFVGIDSVVRGVEVCY